MIRPIPVGFDASNLYMVTPKLISEYNGLTQGGQAYYWSLIMSLGFIIGKNASYLEKTGNGPNQKLVTLEVDSSDSDASGFEPIWKNGKRVGFITSGGYGHRVQKSLAMGLINTDLAESGQEIDVHIVGKEKRCVVLGNSPWDPEGSRMRS